MAEQKMPIPPAVAGVDEGVKQDGDASDKAVLDEVKR
jgi:hypothetical protein